MLHLFIEWILGELWVRQNLLELIIWCLTGWSSQVCECVRRVLRSSLYREPCGSHRIVCSNCWQRQTQRQSRQSNRFDGQRVNTTVSRLNSALVHNSIGIIWHIRTSLPVVLSGCHKNQYIDCALLHPGYWMFIELKIWHALQHLWRRMCVLLCTAVYCVAYM